MPSGSERSRYVGPPPPVVFPEAADLPETQVHFELRVLLCQLLCDHLRLGAVVGSDRASDVLVDRQPPSGCASSGPSLVGG